MAGFSLRQLKPSVVWGLLVSVIVILLLLIWWVDKKLPIQLATPIAQADKVLVYKAERRLELWQDQTLIKRYAISLGFNPKGHKQQEGDGKTPEGEYVLDWRNPNSRFHLSLHISYPNAQDQQQAQARGVAPGSAIMIHGLPNGLGGFAGYFQGKDWTQGCIAVTNTEMEEIWSAVKDGTPIILYP